MEKRPFLSLAQQQGVSSALSEQSGELMCVLPTASPCLPRAQHQPWQGRSSPGTKAELWRRAAAW